MSTTSYFNTCFVDSRWGTASQCQQYADCMDQNVIYGVYDCTQDPVSGITACSAGALNYQQAQDMCFNQYLLPVTEDPPPPPDEPIEEPPVQYYDPCSKDKNTACLLI